MSRNAKSRVADKKTICDYHIYDQDTHFVWLWELIVQFVYRRFTPQLRIEDAEEVANDTMRIHAEKHETMNKKDVLASKAYCQKTAYWLALDKIEEVQKGWWGGDRLPKDVPRFGLEEHVTDKSSSELTPVQRAINDELQKEIHEKIGRLDKKMQQVFLLKTVEHMTIPEIAEILNIPEGTVRSRYYYAYKKLRKMPWKEV